MAGMRRAMRGMSNREKKHLYREMSRRRNPFRTFFIILLFLLAVFFLLPYFF